MSSLNWFAPSQNSNLKESGSSKLFRNLFLFLLLIGSGMPESVNAQDLEPRRWSHLPTGLTLVGVGYAYTKQDIFFSPAFGITDGTSRQNNFGVSAIRTFDLAGKSARLSLLLPYVTGRWQGNVDEEFTVVHRSGVADPRLRFSVNLYGAPALKAAEFVQYQAEHKSNTTVGASVALTIPLGQYKEDKLINIGSNRWLVRPQIGVLHTRGPWSFELTGSAFVFTDNNDFVVSAVLKQKTIYAAQAHATYVFSSGLWASLGTAYGSGGNIIIDDVKTDYEVDNWLMAASIGFPVSRSQGIKLTWLSGRTQNHVGRDSDNLLLSWSIRWLD